MVAALLCAWSCHESPRTAPEPSDGQPGPSAQPAEVRPDKLVFAFQKQKDPREVRSAAQTLAGMLSQQIGIPVEVLVPASYGASVQAVVSGRAHVFYVSSVPYLLARENAPVDLLLAEQRDGRTDYDSVFVVQRDAPYRSLEDLRGKRMMFTSPTSTSGYVMAYSRLVDEGLLAARQDPEAFFGDFKFANGYDRALLAVLNGQADACAVSEYAIEGPQADAYLSAEQRRGLRVLAETPGVPTHVVAARADLPVAVRAQVKRALLDISRARPDLLADVYGAARFVEAEPDVHLAAAVRALSNTGLAAKVLVK